jgi:hypothetical protein
LNAPFAPGSLARDMTAVTPISEVGAYVGVEKPEPQAVAPNEFP